MDDASSPKKPRPARQRHLSPEEYQAAREREKAKRRIKVANRRLVRQKVQEKLARGEPVLDAYRQDQVRIQIGVSNIVSRLEKCANGKLKMTKEQIACARVLLAKTLPDLQRVEVSGRDGEPIEFRDVNTLSDQDLLSIALSGGSGDSTEETGQGKPN